MTQLEKMIDDALRTESARSWWRGASLSVRHDIIDILLTLGLRDAVDEVDDLATGLV